MKAPSFDDTVQWFAETIRQPISLDSELLNSELSQKANEFILPSPTLQPFSRIEIYAQQYWWRLYNTLHEQFPVTTRLFGYSGFNEAIAKPFLLKYPPLDWNINYLGRRLPLWVQENYTGSDLELISATVKMDWAYMESFLGASAPLPSVPEEILYLSPTTFLFELKWDIFTFRKLLLEQEPNYWVDNDFPKLDKNKIYFILVRRTPKGNVTFNEIEELEFRLLQQFEKGVSLNALCQIADEKANLDLWIPRWIKNRLITSEKPTFSLTGNI